MLDIEDALALALLTMLAAAWLWAPELSVPGSGACDGASCPSSPSRPPTAPPTEETGTTPRAEFDSTSKLLEDLSPSPETDTSVIHSSPPRGEGRAGEGGDLETLSGLNDKNYNHYSYAIPSVIHALLMEELRIITGVMEAVLGRLARLEASASRWLSALETLHSHISRMQSRIGELQAENASLRMQLLALQTDRKEDSLRVASKALPQRLQEAEGEGKEMEEEVEFVWMAAAAGWAPCAEECPEAISSVDNEGEAVYDGDVLRAPVDSDYASADIPGLPACSCSRPEESLPEAQHPGSDLDQAPPLVYLLGGTPGTGTPSRGPPEPGSPRALAASDPEEDELGHGEEEDEDFEII